MVNNLAAFFHGPGAGQDMHLCVLTHIDFPRVQISCADPPFDKFNESAQ